MKKWKIIVLAILIGGIGAGIYGYLEWNRKPASTSEKEAIASFKADSLASIFEDNDSIATIQFTGKIISLEGVVEQCTKDHGVVRLRLKGSDMSGIICEFEAKDSAQSGQAQPGATVCLKGQCNTYQKVDMLPGGDLLLSNCVVTEYKK